MTNPVAITLTQAKTRQAQLKSEANRLLDTLRLVDLFNHYGKYVIRGGYARDLLTKRDIDGTIYVDHYDVNRILDLTASLVKSPGIERVTVENRSLMAREHAKGWAVRIKAPFEGNLWSIDTFLLKRADATGHDYLGEHTYTPAQHDAMLLIKAQLTQLNLYPGSSKVPGSFASIDVYRAVLEDGVRTTKEMMAWSETHDYYGKRT